MVIMVGPVTGTALGAAPAHAWNCQVQIKAAGDAIKKAEGMKMPAEARAPVDEAKRLVAESKKHHGEAKVDHAYAMWKAKAAQPQAESAVCRPRDAIERWHAFASRSRSSPVWP